jgi:hypothetical protein
MQTLATGVGDLKRVLTNVKSRGVLGEYQLENLLEQRCIILFCFYWLVCTHKTSLLNITMEFYSETLPSSG